MKTNQNDFQIEPRNVLGRRTFLKQLGAGLTIAISLSDFKTLGAATAPRRELPSDWNAFLRVGEDGRVTCFTGKIEMGQGVNTSLAQMMAEELDVSLDDVDMVMGDTFLCPYDAGTWGSMTTRFFGPPLRAAAAEARGVLLDMAAEQLKVSKDLLYIENGVVYVKSNKKNQVTYAQLTKGKQVMRQLKEKPPLKKPSEFKIIGKSVPRKDGRLKVTGGAKYAGDIRLPNMLYASILRPPVHGAKLLSVNTSAVEKIPQMEIVRDGDFIAILHPFPETAMIAVNKIEAKWDVPESTVDQNNIYEHLLKTGTNSRIHDETGNLEAGHQKADLIIESDYHDPYVAHAPIETHTATAMMEGDIMTIWASTQTPFGSQEEVAKALNMPLEKVHMKEIFIGGGFGGKIDAPQCVEVARIAKLSGKPVQLIWSRREEFFYDTYHSAAVIKIASGSHERRDHNLLGL